MDLGRFKVLLSESRILDQAIHPACSAAPGALVELLRRRVP